MLQCSFQSQVPLLYFALRAVALFKPIDSAKRVVELVYEFVVFCDLGLESSVELFVSRRISFVAVVEVDYLTLPLGYSASLRFDCIFGKYIVADVLLRVNVPVVGMGLS